MKIVLVLFTCLVLSGCTTAGPFVSNISSDGKGNLIIEKHSVKMNPFTDTITNVGSTTTHIKVVPE